MATAPIEAAAPVDPILLGAAIFLGAAVVAVPLFKRVGLGSVLGYLGAGAVIGPFGLGLFSDAASVLHIAEFGVVLLLFVIGLELRPARLWRLRHEIFGLGLAQVALTWLAISLVLWQSRVMELVPAVAAGAALALSSTAFAVQILREKGQLTTGWGDRSVSILLFQDLAIVPIVALIAFLAPGTDGRLGWEPIALGFAAICAVLFAGRFLMRPVFRAIALTKADEIFTAAALLVVVGTALLMQLAGLSMAMGAFIAGVLLSESEFRHQLETDIEPFRGLLLGLFFMGVGMQIDLPAVMDAWFVVLGGALGLYIVKSAILFGLTRAAGSERDDAQRIAALLGQGGEFGFVIFSFGLVTGIWDADLASLLSAMVSVTMALTPLANVIADRLKPASEPDMSGVETVDDKDTAPVIVWGFGRFGQIVARILKMRGYEITLIDNDPNRIRIAESFGTKVFYGDVRRSDVMRIAGAAEARAIFLCMDDQTAILQAIGTLKRSFPGTLILARAADRFAELQMRELGVDAVFRETFESAIAMSRAALELMGDAEIAEETIEEFRRRDAELLRLQARYGAHDAVEKMRERFSLEAEH